MSFTRKLGIGFAGMAAVTATVWTYQQQDTVVEKQKQNVLKKMDRQALQDFESRNAVDLKKMQQQRTERLVQENRNLAWVMGQDTLKTLQDKQAIHIKKGQPIQSSNTWKQAGVRKKETVEKVELKDEDKAVEITKIEENSNETKKKGWLW